MVQEKNEKTIKINNMNYLKKIFRRAYIEYLRQFDLKGYNCYMYELNTGRKVNLKNPRTLDDKIIYMSFYTDTSKWSELADKVKVRDYIIAKGYGDILTKQYGVYTTPDEIDFDALPADGFVIKTNNASTTNIIIRDKSNLNVCQVKNQLRKWLKWNYSKISGDPHYAKIKPMILIEELLKDDSPFNTPSLADFKFFCSEGRPLCVEMMTDRTRTSHRRRFYDMEWNVRDEWMMAGYPVADVAEKPVVFDEMKAIASDLSKEFKFVRVDFYIINGKPVFGELTFTPGATECSTELEYYLGDNIHL